MPNPLYHLSLLLLVLVSGLNDRYLEAPWTTVQKLALDIGLLAIYACSMNYQLLANKLYVLSVLIDEIGHDTANALSKSSVAAVFTLKYRRPLSITKLGRIIGLTQPATTRLVEGLVRGGIVQKSSGPSAREVDIHLTSRGSTLANKLQAKRLERIGNLVAKLSVSEQNQLDGLLATMVGAAVESRAQARYLCRFCDHDICDGPVCPVGSAATEIEEHEGR